MKKKLLVRSLLGAPIGVTVTLVVTIIISLCTGQGDYYPAPHELMELCGNWMNAVLVQTVCALFVGAAFGASSVVWDMERWSMLKQTLVHFVAIVVSSFPLAYVMYWIPHYFLGALCYVALFVVVYAVIWILMYFSAKAKIKRLNEKLNVASEPEENEKQ